MKEYKYDRNSYFWELTGKRFYSLNGNIHGFTYSENWTKGYFNMGVIYSHWLEYGDNFFYFL